MMIFLGLSTQAILAAVDEKLMSRLATKWWIRGAERGKGFFF